MTLWYCVRFFLNAKNLVAIGYWLCELRKTNVALTGHTGYVIEEIYALVYGQALEATEAWQQDVPMRVLT